MQDTDRDLVSAGQLSSGQLNIGHTLGVEDDLAATVKLVAVPHETQAADGSQIFELVWQAPSQAQPVSTSVLPDTVSEQTSNPKTCKITSRKRERKRPFSPDNVLAQKNQVKRKANKKFKKCLNEVAREKQPQSFSCEKCGSAYVIHPIRSHPSTHKQRAPRRVFDSATQRVMLLCNACGLSAQRTQKKLSAKESEPVDEGKESYKVEAENFAASLAVSLQDDDANRLYCPAFKKRPCRCVQNHILSAGSEGIHTHALYLLNLIKKARQLIKQKGATEEDKLQFLGGDKEDSFNRCNENVTTSSSSGTNGMLVSGRRGVCNLRSRIYESFVLKNRSHLKNDFHLCERACQKILLYSNNFIHRQLKTSPKQGPRVERTLGRNVRGLLQPIDKLATLPCCGDGCVALACTHPHLLQFWRAEAAASQRRARRALAEMLTPSGGTKANCYKFISLVTGCSYTTICQVNDQMRRTKGEREPPEHGLKRWWRERRGTKVIPVSKVKEKVPKSTAATKEDVLVVSTTELQRERQHVEELTRQLQKARQRLRQLEQHAGVHQQTQSQIQPQLQSQVLHILEMPSSQAILANNTQSVQVVNMSGELESISNISVSLPTLGNVVVLSDATVMLRDTSPAIASGSTLNGQRMIAATDYNSSVQQYEIPRLQFLDT